MAKKLYHVKCDITINDTVFYGQVMASLRASSAQEAIELAKQTLPPQSLKKCSNWSTKEGR